MLHTALILSGDELYSLAALHGDGVSMQFKNLIQKICPKNSDSFDIISALQEKRLARWDGNTLALEPMLKLVIDQACAATSLYEPVQESYALECPNMQLLFTRYEWAENMWRVEPFKDISTLHLSLSSG